MKRECNIGESSLQVANEVIADHGLYVNVREMVGVKTRSLITAPIESFRAVSSKALGREDFVATKANKVYVRKLVGV